MSISGPAKLVTVSPTAPHRCGVSAEQYCPSAKLRRWDPATHYTLRRNAASIKKILFGSKDDENLSD